MSFRSSSRDGGAACICFKHIVCMFDISMVAIDVFDEYLDSRRVRPHAVGRSRSSPRPQPAGLVVCCLCVVCVVVACLFYAIACMMFVCFCCDPSLEDPSRPESLRKLCEGTRKKGRREPLWGHDTLASKTAASQNLWPPSAGGDLDRARAEPRWGARLSAGAGAWRDAEHDMYTYNMCSDAYVC